MRQPAVMVHVQMGENHPLDVARTNAERAQLRTDLLFAVDAKRDLPADIGMQRLAGFEQMRALPGIDNDNAFAGVDRPCVGGQPTGPVPVGENRKPPRQAMPPPLDLRCLDPDETGLNGVNLHDGNLRGSSQPEMPCRRWRRARQLKRSNAPIVSQS